MEGEDKKRNRQIAIGQMRILIQEVMYALRHMT